jgi:hypothetical protein
MQTKKGCDKMNDKQPTKSTTIAIPKCDHCGRPYIPTGPQQKFCSERCRIKAWLAANKTAKK